MLSRQGQLAHPGASKTRECTCYAVQLAIKIQIYVNIIRTYGHYYVYYCVSNLYVHPLNVCT